MSPSRRSPRPRIVGLVGGIASGKSSVARLWLDERSGSIVDADAIARRVLARPTVGRRVAERFPRAVDGSGAIDRAALASIVFGDAAEREALEAITHPPIRRAIRTALDRVTGDFALLDAPLLLETGLDALCHWVVYVAVPARTRRSRAIRDRGWTADEHRARESHQWSCRRKRARADFVIDNSGTPATARRDVRRAIRAIEKAKESPARVPREARN